VIGVVQRVVTFVFLLFVKLSMGIEVVTGAQRAQTEHCFGPVKLQRAPVRFIRSWISTGESVLCRPSVSAFSESSASTITDSRLPTATSFGVCAASAASIRPA
jgi:hypothetical protein